MQWWEFVISYEALVEQNHVDVQIFSTAHACGKHVVICVISTGMPVTSLAITNLAIFTKEWLCSQQGTVKVIPW